ncbi:MAG: aldehyde dehydrogenase family protein [Rhodocyclaceae bacterium]|nr:aldehyde dehydrogenase family protein [Rhodocyclaceae bacterium]MBX3670982.1 aldehyde dehydrogenase family protein [Rhodocyclaceae bacterium]
MPAVRTTPVAAVDSAGLLAELRLAGNNPGALYGADVEAPGAGHFSSENPAGGNVLAEIGRASIYDYERVIESAVQAAARLGALPAPARGELVRRIAVRLREQKPLLAMLVSIEVGKIRSEGAGEIQEMIDIADFAVGLARQFGGRTLASERPSHRLFEQWHPLGVVGVITAFNFPAAVWAWNAFIALVCGNAVVWKPSPKAPLVALAVHRIVAAEAAAAGMPGVFGLLLSDEALLGQRMAGDTRIALLSFTGSSAVGKTVAQSVAARMGRSLLECSGNNAVIVAPDADLELVAPAVLFGAVGTAGQRCTSTRRLIVHETLYEPLLARLARAYARVRIGDPLDAATLLGPLIDAHARDLFRAAIAEVCAAGGEIVFGGRHLDGPGYFVQPTLVRAHADWPVVRRETFAPILYAMSYRDTEEAIALNNAVEQGLSSSIFTRDIATAEAFLSARGSDCGIANVNCGTSGAEIGAAFGGEKATGGGREAGSDAWKSYMRRQAVTINWGRELPLAQGVHFSLDD